MNRRFPLVIPLLITAWISFYFWFAYQYSINIPIGDDLELLLHYWANYQAATSVSEKISLVVGQFIDHRMGYMRFVFLVLAQFGRPNFQLMALIANLSLVGLFFIFRQVLCRVCGLPTVYLLPVAFLLFQPCYSFDGIIWVAGAMSYMTVLTGAVLTLYLLTQPTNRAFWLAVFTGVVTTYTFGNGQFVLLIGLMLLAMQQRWQAFWGWLAVSILTLLSFYLSYYIPTSRPDVFQNLAHFPAYIVYNALMFLGAMTERDESAVIALSSSNALSLLLGASVILTLGFLGVLWLKARFRWPAGPWLEPLSRVTFGDKRGLGPFWLGALAFFVMTGFVLAIARTDSEHIFTQTNRYRIHSVCALLLVYGFIVAYSRHRRWWLISCSTASILFGLYSYFFFAYYFAEGLRTTQAGLYNWQHEKQWYIYRETAYWEPFSKRLSHLVENRLADTYRFPESIFEQGKPVSTPVPIQVFARTDGPQHIPVIVLQNTVMPGDYPEPADGVYVLLRSNRNKILLPANLVRHSLIGFVRTGQYYNSGFALALNSATLPEGTYRVGLIRRQHSQNTLLPTNASFTVDRTALAQNHHL